MPLLGPEGREQMKTFGRVSTVGFELVLSVLVGLFGGRWLDEELGTAPWLQWVGLGFGLAAGIRSVVRVARIVRRDLEAETRPTEDESEPVDD